LFNVYESADKLCDTMLDNSVYNGSACLLEEEDRPSPNDGRATSSNSSDNERASELSPAVGLGTRTSFTGDKNDSDWTNLDATSHLSVGSSSSCPGQFSSHAAYVFPFLS